MKTENEKYCSDCGQLINIKAEICPKCGVRQMQAPEIKTTETKDSRWLTCFLLCWFVGVFGIHRFYTGHRGTAIIQLLTLGGCGVWAFIDLIVIAMGNFKDSEGNVIKNK